MTSPTIIGHTTSGRAVSFGEFWEKKCETQIHEAGHAVAFVLAGRRIREITIYENSLSGGIVVPKPFKGKLSRSVYVNDAAVSCAGPLAVLRFCPGRIPAKYRARLSDSLFPMDGDRRPYPSSKEIDKMGFLGDFEHLRLYRHEEEGEKLAKEWLARPDVQNAIIVLQEELMGWASDEGETMPGEYAERVIKEALKSGS
jgi:hypothetical protein